MTPISSAIDRCRATPPRRGTGERADGRAGFTLMEVVLAMTIIAMLAALGLPFLRPDAGVAALRTKAFGIMALLRAERNAALRSGTAATVLVNIDTRSIRSTTSAARIDLPPSMSLRIMPERLAGIQFLPDGRASNARLTIISGNDSVAVDVNGLTAAVNLAGGPP